MSDLRLVQSRITNGRWQGVILAGPHAPEVEVTHLSSSLANLSIEADGDGAGRWKVSLPIPAELLSDGVQTFVLRDKPSGQTLGAFTIVTGIQLEDDIRAEVDLLRAELDLLKKAFRRHCVETTS